MFSNLGIEKYMDDGISISFRSTIEIVFCKLGILLIQDFAVKIGSLISMVMMRSLGVKAK